MALDGDEVVGLLQTVQTGQDQGASSLPLLNVPFDYHGKKVGKLLVPRAVEEACPAPLAAPGPVYMAGQHQGHAPDKKCGFFWENRDAQHPPDEFHAPMCCAPRRWPTFSGTPTGMPTQSGDYRRARRTHRKWFWYTSTAGNIGDRCCAWNLSAGAGVCRLIETDDWLVEAWIEGPALVFGRSYKTCYRVATRAANP